MPAYVVVVPSLAVLKTSIQESNCPNCSAHKVLFQLFKSGIPKLSICAAVSNADGAFLITVQRLTFNAGWRLFEHSKRLVAAVSLN